MADNEPQAATGIRVFRAAGLVRSAAARLGGALANTIMPPACLACRAPLGSHDALCVPCWSAIAFIRPPLCDRLGMPMPFDTGGVMVSAAAVSEPPDYDRARAAARYDGTVRKLIHDLKFRDRHDSRRLLAQWMAMAGAELLTDAEMVVPVPLGRRRLVWRRFNQAALLAQEVALLKSIAFEPEALLRVRATRSQVGLTRAERHENVRGAFVVPAGMKLRISGKRVVLVDDVITTGATAGAAAKTLKRAGAARVDVLAVAMVTDEALVPA